MPDVPVSAMPGSDFNARAPTEIFTAYMDSLEGEIKAAEASLSLAQQFATQSTEILTRGIHAQWLHLGKNGGNSIAASQQMAAAKGISFAAVKAILTEEYKKKEIPALGLLAVGAVVQMYENEKVGGIEISAADIWWVALEVLKVRGLFGTHDSNKSLIHTDWVSKVAQNMAIEFIKDQKYAPCGPVRFSVADCHKYVTTMWFHWSGRHGAKITQQRAFDQERRTPKKEVKKRTREETAALPK